MVPAGLAGKPCASEGAVLAGASAGVSVAVLPLSASTVSKITPSGGGSTENVMEPSASTHL